MSSTLAWSCGECVFPLNPITSVCCAICGNMAPWDCGICSDQNIRTPHCPTCDDRDARVTGQVGGPPLRTYHSGRLSALRGTGAGYTDRLPFMIRDHDPGERLTTSDQEDKEEDGDEDEDNAVVVVTTGVESKYPRPGIAQSNVILTATSTPISPVAQPLPFLGLTRGVDMLRRNSFDQKIGPRRLLPQVMPTNDQIEQFSRESGMPVSEIMASIRPPSIPVNISYIATYSPRFNQMDIAMEESIAMAGKHKKPLAKGEYIKLIPDPKAPEFYCVICLETRAAGYKTVIKTLCQHYFCHSCIMEWMCHDHTCPICRAKIGNKEV